VLTVQVGRRRQDVPLADVVGIDTVRDRVREFFARLDRLPDNLTHRWFMAQWAAEHELHDLARLTALDVVLRDPDHEGAHTMLGHRRIGAQWSWPCDDEWKPIAALDSVRADWQHAWCIEGEHFHVKSDADLRRVVDAVWDLERFHIVWFDRFGQALSLHEVVAAKMHVEIRRDERRFPGIRTVPGRTTGKNPFFQHNAEPKVSHTYFADASAPRPERLFEVASCHLLCFTVADDPDYHSGYRPAAWGELGLARYLERSMTGPAGRAVPAAWRIDATDGRLVLDHPARDLHHVTQYDSKKLWGGVSDDNEFEWPAAELAVAYLLEAGQAGGLRDGFLGYLLEVLRPVKGSSSTVLDRRLGQPIEALDAPWRTWIQQQIDATTQVVAPSTRVR
jgi:hypothetical protein